MMPSSRSDNFRVRPLKNRPLHSAGEARPAELTGEDSKDQMIASSCVSYTHSLLLKLAKIYRAYDIDLIHNAYRLFFIDNFVSSGKTLFS